MVQGRNGWAFNSIEEGSNGGRYGRDWRPEVEDDSALPRGTHGQWERRGGWRYRFGKR
jgi:hypothetical protein